MAMQTRGNLQNYLALNDGYDSEAASEDWISSPLSPATQDLEEPRPLPHSLSQSAISADINSCVEILDDEVLPSESASQPPVTAASSQIAQPTPQKTERLRSYFQTREFPNEWIEKRNKKKRFIDQEIRCTLTNKDTGKQCNWSTTDSKRLTSTTNIRHHLKEKPSDQSSITLTEEVSQSQWDMLLWRGISSDVNKKTRVVTRRSNASFKV
ncbi:hypothetical protein V1504DRAFT_459728 [Lipomyces starkeyi]